MSISGKQDVMHITFDSISTSISCWVIITLIKVAIKYNMYLRWCLITFDMTAANIYFKKALA
jgi:hypothetical protein